MDEELVGKCVEDVEGPTVLNGELLGDVLLVETPFELVGTVDVVEERTVFDWE